MLVAAKVDSENPHRAAGIINSHPGVSHNYLRTHEFNLWFTIATPPGLRARPPGDARSPAAPDRRRVDPPAADADPLQDQHEPRDGEGDGRARRARRGRAAARARAPALRRPRRRGDPGPPGADGGDRAPLRRGRGGGGDDAPELLDHLRGMVDRKILRRVAAILYHRRAGFSANGMGVWRVPDDQILDVGGRMASVRGISHCYQRPTYEDWPYSVFTMAHGRSKEECDAVLQSIADEHGLHGPDRAVLYSSTEFKKIRLHYFTADYGEWERGEQLSRVDTRASAAPLRARGRASAGRRQLARARDALDRARPPDLRRARPRASSSSTSTVTATWTGSAPGAR